MSDTLKIHSRLLLQASPGSGKTTRVPPALLSQVPGEIWVLEPRRLAAKWAAHRVADELGEPLGETVGYQFRFEKKESPRTRLRFLTEGILLRKLARDPELRGVDCVILDEFHERHLTTDLALTCLLEVQKKRPELKLILMSATLDIQGLLPLLGPQTPTLQVEAPRHPVEIRHLGSAASETRLEDLVAHHARSLLRETQGDILVFLPGMREIRRVEASLQTVPAQTLILHGDLTREEQDLVMRPGSTRRVILSTNLAESSLTIPGISAVIDSGLHRIASFSSWSGVPALRTRPISKASATQRAGRAGRTGPGVCQRLYGLADLEGRPPFEIPEIKRSDLAQVILDLRSLGIESSLATLSWLDFPELSQWAASARLLWLLGFLESPTLDSKLTALGKKAANLSMHPRMARLLLEAWRAQRLQDWLPFAVVLSEGNLAELTREPEGPIAASRLSRTERLILDQWEREVEFAFRDLALSNSNPRSNPTTIPLSKALLAAYPDRVVSKVGSQIVSATAGPLELHREIGEKLTLLQKPITAVALEVQERQSRDLGQVGQSKVTPVIEAWVPIQEDWLLDLDPSLIQDSEKPLFDEKQKRVQWSSRLSYGEIALSEELRSPRSTTEWKQAETLLLRSAWRTELPEGPVALGSAQSFVAHLKNQGLGDLAELIETFLARVLLIREHQLLDFELPSYSDLLSSSISGKLSLRELEETDWESAISGALLELIPGLRLRDWTPTQITLPGPPQGAKPGPRNARIHYELGCAPWVASRLQDFWGLKSTPTILGGRLPLTLHLLAPNQRAVQVTRDLLGFWQKAYPEIKKELSRNYPRHFWP